MTALDVRARLDEVRLVLDAIRRLRERCDDLQTVEQARAAYEALLAGENAALAALQERLRGLEVGWRGRTLPDEVDEGLEPWKPVPTQPGRRTPPVVLPHPPGPAPAGGPAGAVAAAQSRRRLARP